MLLSKFVRSSTAPKHRSNQKYNGKASISTRKDSNPAIKGSSSSAGVRHSERMDKFLSRHQSATKTNLSSHPSRDMQEHFRTESAVLPCDWTDTNHFGREGREDLRQSDFHRERQVRMTTESEDLKRAVRRYASEDCTPQTFNYFANVIRKRVDKDRRQQLIEQHKLEDRLRNGFKSGVTGYRFMEDVPNSRVSRRLRKCNNNESAWRSSVFEFANENPTKITASRQYKFRNLLSLEPQPLHRKQREANLRRNQCRRDYNFITMERC